MAPWWSTVLLVPQSRSTRQYTCRQNDSNRLAVWKCTILSFLKELWLYTALYKVLLRAQEITTWSHIQFDRPRHLCSKPAQATSSESSTAQSSERPSWSQPMGSCAATEKWWVQPSSLSKRKANISNVYKCIVSNIAIYDYPYHDWFYIRVYNIIYTYLYVYIYIYRVIYHSYCAYVCSLTSHSWTHDTHTHTNMMQQQRASWVLE